MVILEYAMSFCFLIFVAANSKSESECDQEQGAYVASAPAMIQTHNGIQGFPAEDNVTFVDIASHEVAANGAGRSGGESRRLPTESGYALPFPPEIKSVMIDVGLYNSILEPKADEWVVAVEASVREIERFKLHSKCEKLQRCHLINAAVGESNDTFTTLHQSTREGGSSHITNFDPKVWPMDMAPAVVPVISLKSLIDAVPSSLPISLCKTDTNGNDVYVIKSAGPSLQRCQRLTMEIVGNKDGTGPKDQYETALSFTKEQGFVLAPGLASDQRDSGSYNLFFVKHGFESVYKDHIPGATVEAR